MGEIDWARLAEPQADGYDTAITKELAKARYGWEKRWPPRSVPTWLDGAVELVEPSRPEGDNVPAEATHPNLAVAERLLREGYPAMYTQCRELVQALHVYRHKNVGIDAMETGVSCGPKGNQVSFEISVTINGGVGIVEGVVHELAHNKMKAHGISFHHWERLMLNAPATDDVIKAGIGPNLYPSPVRHDILRPLGACISAHYSYLYVAETLLQLVGRDVIAPPERYVGWIDVQKQRVDAGRRLVAEHVRTDKAGSAYFGALQDWADRIIARVEALKRKTGDRMLAQHHAPSVAAGDAVHAYHGDSFIAEK